MITFLIEKSWIVRVTQWISDHHRHSFCQSFPGSQRLLFTLCKFKLNWDFSFLLALEVKNIVYKFWKGKLSLAKLKIIFYQTAQFKMLLYLYTFWNALKKKKKTKRKKPFEPLPFFELMFCLIPLNLSGPKESAIKQELEQQFRQRCLGFYNLYMMDISVNYSYAAQGLSYKVFECVLQRSRGASFHPEAVKCSWL